MEIIFEREARYEVQGRDREDEEWGFISAYDESFQAEAHARDMTAWRFIRVIDKGERP